MKTLNYRHILKTKFILFFAFVLLNPGISISQVLPLDSVLARIEANNPALLSYVNKINSSRELVKGARAYPAPSAGVMFDDNPYSFRYGSRMIDFSVSQSFPNRKALNAKENYLNSLSEIPAQESGQLKNELFAQAKIHYFERYISESKIRVLHENSALMKSMIDISERQMASGMGDLGSIYKMKARLSDTEAMLVHEENVLKTKTSELNYLMASDLNQAFARDTHNLLKDYRGKLLPATSEILELRRSDIRRMNNEITSMKLNRILMSTMSKPEMTLSGKHYLLSGQADLFAAEAMVMIPIAPWSAKGYKSKVKAMGFDIEAMQQEKQALLNAAAKEVNMFALELNAEYSEVEKYEQDVIPAYKKSFDANLLAYSQNTGDLMKVILALDDLQMAQMEYLRHFGTLLKAQAEYEREMQIR